MSHWQQILLAILGTAEKVIPVFIHNPKSQQIEAVVVSTLDGVLSGLATVTPPPETPK